MLAATDLYPLKGRIMIMNSGGSGRHTVHGYTCWTFAEKDLQTFEFLSHHSESHNESGLKSRIA